MNSSNQLKPEIKANTHLTRWMLSHICYDELVEALKIEVQRIVYSIYNEVEDLVGQNVHKRVWDIARIQAQNRVAAHLKTYEL